MNLGAKEHINSQPETFVWPKRATSVVLVVPLSVEPYADFPGPLLAVLARCMTPMPYPFAPAVFNHLIKSGGSTLKKQLYQSCHRDRAHAPGDACGWLHMFSALDSA